MDLVLVARRRDRLDALAGELSSRHGIQAHVIEMDLTDLDSAARIRSDVMNHNIEVGMLVNNAGCGSLGLFTRLDPVREAKLVDLNCRAPVMLTSLFAPEMVKRRRGAIVFVSSLAAYQPTPYLATYGASKAFNLIFAEALWGEIGRYGVDVLALSPGFTHSEFHQAAGFKEPPNVVWASAGEVVETALRYLGRRPSVVDGWRNWMVSCLSRFFSRKMMAWGANHMRSRALNGSRRIEPE